MIHQLLMQEVYYLFQIQKAQREAGNGVV